MSEVLAILLVSWMNLDKIISLRLELFGSCAHKTRFYKHKRTKNDSDEDIKLKRLLMAQVLNSETRNTIRDEIPKLFLIII